MIIYSYDQASDKVEKKEYGSQQYDAKPILLTYGGINHFDGAYPV